jgi:hypothetical protein
MHKGNRIINRIRGENGRGVQLVRVLQVPNHECRLCLEAGNFEPLFSVLLFFGRQGPNRLV